jgi:hypothetical protein
MEEKNKAIHSKAKLLLLKKINLKKYPELDKNLKDFFWNSDKYFQQTYKGKYILLGNKDTRKINTPIANKRKIFRAKTKKFLNLSLSNDKKHLNESKRTASDASRIDRKKGLFKNIKESGLKVGQKYINDFEIEDLFSAFKLVQKLNSKKTNNFITVKDFIDKNTSLISKKSSKNFNRFLSENRKVQINKNNLPDLGYEKKSSSSLVTNLKNSSKKVNDYNKATSAVVSFNINKTDNKENKENKEQNISTPCLKKKNIFCSIYKINEMNNEKKSDIQSYRDKKSKTAQNFYCKKALDSRSVFSRNMLIKKQNQYLLNSTDKNFYCKNKTQRIILAKLLANQEQTILKTKKNQLKVNNIYKLLSERTHKSKGKLLMTNIDSFRIKMELKDKFNYLKTKLEPENNYDWTKYLRDESNLIKDTNINLNIRDPYNKTFYKVSSNKTVENNNSKYYKNIIDETNNINSNLEGLYIKGKNLLKIEYEQIKSIKNKKIINNYETYLPSTDVEDILFTDKKYINTKVQKAEQLL